MYTNLVLHDTARFQILKICSEVQESFVALSKITKTFCVTI